MRARSLPALAFRQVESWIFGAGDPRRLAACRIGLCLLLAARLSRPLYLHLAGQPPPLFRPISFMHLFPAMPAAGPVIAVQVVAVVACLLGAAGALTRIAIPVAWVGALFLDGMWTSLGQPMHNETPLVLAMVPLLFAPAGDAWSVDAWRSRGPSARVPGRYGWPVRTGMVVVAGGYFFSGLNKLEFSGPAWFLGDNLRWVMYGISDESRSPVRPALLLANHPLLAHLAAAGTIATEIGFPICLWKPRAAWLFVPAVVLLHVGIGLTMHLDYSVWALTAIILFVPWDDVADRWSRLRAGRVGVASP